MLAAVSARATVSSTSGRPSTEQQRAVGVRERLIRLVRREQDRHAACAQPIELAQHAHPVAEVQARRRLVEDQQRRLLRERAGDHHELPLAARDLGDGPRGERADAERCERVGATA